jgi:hypothetical protein
MGPCVRRDDDVGVRRGGHPAFPRSLWRRVVRAQLKRIAPWALLRQRENHPQTERITADSAVQFLVSVKGGYRTPEAENLI